MITPGLFGLGLVSLGSDARSYRSLSADLDGDLSPFGVRPGESRHADPTIDGSPDGKPPSPLLPAPN